MGNKMNLSKLKMIIKEEVTKSLFEAAPAAPVASTPPAVPGPVPTVKFDQDSFAMQRHLQSEQSLTVDFKNAFTRLSQLSGFYNSLTGVTLMQLPGKSGTRIEREQLNASLNTQRADIYKFWIARYEVLGQYVRSGDGLRRLLGQKITREAQDFLDKGANSSVVGKIHDQINAIGNDLNLEVSRNLLIEFLKILGYSSNEDLKKQNVDFYSRRIFDIINISIVPLSVIINPPKNKVAADTSTGKSTQQPAQTPLAAQTPQSADPSSKKSNATNWDQYVKATPNGGAAVKSAWEAFAATGKVKPDYYSFVAWYKKSKSARPDWWNDGPDHIARLLQANAKLYGTPAAAPASSITPGSAAAQTPKP